MNYPFNSVGEFSPENSVKSSLFYLSCEIRIIHSTMMKIKLPWGGKNGGKFNWKSALRMSWWNNKKKLYLILCWEWKSERANKTIHRTAKRNAIIAAFFASLPHSTFCLFCSFSELLMLSKLHQTPQHFFFGGMFFFVWFSMGNKSLFIHPLGEIVNHRKYSSPLRCGEEWSVWRVIYNPIPSLHPDRRKREGTLEEFFGKAVKRLLRGYEKSNPIKKDHSSSF